MKKKIEIDVISLIAILLILSSIFLLIVYYFNYEEQSCIIDPVAYANDNSNDYVWDYVYGVKYRLR